MSTNRTLPTTGGAGGGGGSSGAMTLLGTATVTGAAATNLSLTGLSLDAYKSFFVVINLLGTGADSNNSVGFNSDTTAANYNVTRMRVTTVTLITRAVNAILGALVVGAGTVGHMWIYRDLDGRATAEFRIKEENGALITYRDGFVRWATNANVTEVGFYQSVASSLAIGSTFSVFGVK